MGSWWLYLIFELSSRLQLVQGQSETNIIKIIKWEGAAFLILILIIFISHTLLFLKDQKKTKSLHTFFAGLTHELKTPLASMKLQSEVISLEAERLESERLSKLCSRLNEDAVRLETQLDKILQLSRVERDGELNIVTTNIIQILKNVHKNYQAIDLEIKSIDEDIEVHADEFALELIFKNLFENTINHAKSKKAQIKITPSNKDIILSYSDGGNFRGEANKLATLFYKHDSTNGSGIGLYLCKKLLSKMNGELKIETSQSLKFHLRLKRSNFETQGAQDVSIS